MRILCPIRERVSTSAGLVIAVTCSLGVAACGGAEAGGAAPKAPDMQSTTPRDEAPEPKSVEEAQEQIARAREALESTGKDDDGPKKKTETESISKEPSAPAKLPSGGGPASATGREERGMEDSCGNPCRALASMKRAVEALCRMTGDTDDRCVDAKKTLTESTTRLGSCKCEAR